MEHKILTTVKSLLFKFLSGSAHAQWDNIERNFDSEAWKISNRKTRGEMTDHLIKDRLLYGKTIPEVIEMLGLPDKQHSAKFNYAVISENDHLNSYLCLEFEQPENTVKFVELFQ